MEEALPKPPKSDPALPVPKKAKKNHIRATFVPSKDTLIPMKNNIMFINPLCTITRIKTILHKKLVEESQAHPPEVQKGWFYNTTKHITVKPCDSIHISINGEIIVPGTKIISEFATKVASDGVPEIEIEYMLQETFGTC